MKPQAGSLAIRRSKYVDRFKHFYTSIRFWGSASIHTSMVGSMFAGRKAQRDASRLVFGQPIGLPQCFGPVPEIPRVNT